MKSIVLFILLLPLIALGFYVVGIGEGPTSWKEVVVVTVAFAAWQLWKWRRRPKPQGDGKKLGAAFARR